MGMAKNGQKQGWAPKNDPWLVGCCGARAVSPKTPIYFILVKEFYPRARCAIFNVKWILKGCLYLVTWGSSIDIHWKAREPFGSEHLSQLIDEFLLKNVSWLLHWGVVGIFLKTDWHARHRKISLIVICLIWSGGLKRRLGWSGALVLRQMRESFNHYFVFFSAFCHAVTHCQWVIDSAMILVRQNILQNDKL